jgi:hypothetical protein
MRITDQGTMRRATLLIAILLSAAGLSACSKCSVPGFGAQVCSDKPATQ